MTLTSPKALYNQLEESFAMLRTTVCHWFSHVLSIMANMSNHSISKINMATLKKIVSKNLHGNISVYSFRNYTQHILWAYIILLFCLKAKQFQYMFQILQTGHSSKTFFRLIDLCVPKDTSCQLFCILENFYASGTQDIGVTAPLHLILFMTRRWAWVVVLQEIPILAWGRTT